MLLEYPLQDVDCFTHGSAPPEDKSEARWDFSCPYLFRGNILPNTKEIATQARLNKEIQEEYNNEGFAKELDKFIFFAGNGCGDYYCYHAGADGVIDESVINTWNHEEYSWKQVASSITELITRYYHDEI